MKDINKYENFTLLAIFSYPHEYFVLKSLLEAEGIEVILKDDITIYVDPLLSQAIGGIKMYVPIDKYKKAKKIFDEYFNENKSQES
ncbi:MAG: hypothetical protein WBL11_07115 [Bacteroidales bacterium]|jgi:hypothetical protein|nr:DUF2007 domain-containing protein [Bacteroidales bacterium]MDI9575141.1 DUF2007 domain-containing protein [Bacteroidota bacterium]MDD2592937.1 hypothetical protein [Bacteroidales bacterium]MDD3755921.1 hypothetical protein [Bacteroidales bacterium]MDY0400144.1 hypothetical protein [Bacteroidales bacterium]